MEIAKVSFGKGTDYRELVVGLIVHESGIVDCGSREDSEGPQGRQSGNLGGITTAAKKNKQMYLRKTTCSFPM